VPKPVETVYQAHSLVISADRNAHEFVHALNRLAVSVREKFTNVFV
jgi:hypothetical protein